MKKPHFITLIVFATITLFTSCIQEEAPNAECDIIAVKTSWLEDNKEMLSGKPIINNNAVRFYVNEDTDIESLKQLDPQFELTPGAQIKKLDRIEENGNRGIFLYYRTTAEDGFWFKDYEVSFTKRTVIPTDKVFSFEDFSLTSDKNGFYVWNENINNTLFNWWSSGNDGYKMAAYGKPATAYPTTTHSEGYIGNCVKLTTCKTNSLAAGFGMPIAAGNIFMGEFDNTNAMRAPLEATKFGLQIIPDKPVSLTGYYKYTPGEVFTDVEGNVIENRRDECAIYAVLFEVDPDNFIPLNGENVTSSNRIVLIAEIQNPGEPTEWTKFEIPFEQRNGKIFDYEKLANNEYAITVVASSSKGGAFFEGAVGSTLMVDEIKIKWAQE